MSKVLVSLLTIMNNRFPDKKKKSSCLSTNKNSRFLLVVKQTRTSRKNMNFVGTSQSGKNTNFCYVLAKSLFVGKLTSTELRYFFGSSWGQIALCAVLCQDLGLYFKLCFPN